MATQMTALRRRVVGDGIYTLTVRFGNMALAAALGILTARVLGPHGRGIYALPMIAAALVTSGFAGLTTATSYFMLARNAGRSILRPALLTAVILVFVGVAATIAIAAGDRALWSAVPAALSLPASALLMVAYGYAIGIKRVRANTTIALASTLVTLGMMALGLGFFGRTPATAIAVWIVSGALVAAGVGTLLYRHSRTLGAGPVVGVGEFCGYTLRAALASIVTLLNYRGDVYIVALFAAPSALGMYTLAVAAAETLLAATQVTNVVASPHIASSGDRHAADLAARCVRHNLLVALPVCAAIALIAPFAVHILYGVAFLPMVSSLRVLLVGVLALSLGSPISTYFTLRIGKPEVATTLAAVSAGLCIGTSVALVPRWGMIGAAVGSTVGYLIGQVLGIAYFSRRSGIGVLHILVPSGTDVAFYRELAASFMRRVALRGTRAT
jgi:O-antigen/teichoic acid export membrane protein